MQKYELIFSEKNKDNFDRIRHKEKTIETRAGTSTDTEQKYHYSAILEGDLITFICGLDHFQKVVRSVRKYSNLNAFLDAENLEEIFGRKFLKMRPKRCI